MKLIEGHTLADLLASPTETRADRVDRRLEQICQAVAFAHSRGVVHRDLKPGNVMVGAFGEVQVMDWGLAKQIRAASAGGRSGTSSSGPDPGADAEQTTDQYPSGDTTDDRTRAGQAMGTPAYMPPEQARGDRDQIGPPADVFALGGILCAVLTGSPPYVGSAAGEVLRKAAGGAVDDAFARLDTSGADPELVALGKRCLAPNVTDRPANAGEVARVVAVLRAATAERARQAELDRVKAEERAAEERKRRRVVMAAAVTVAAVLLAGAGGSAWQAVRATDAERATGAQLGLTRIAEEQARTEAGNARIAEATANRARAEAVERERKEKTARETAEEAARFMQEVFAQASRGRAGTTRPRGEPEPDGKGGDGLRGEEHRGAVQGPAGTGSRGSANGRPDVPPARREMGRGARPVPAGSGTLGEGPRSRPPQHPLLSQCRGPVVPVPLPGTMKPNDSCDGLWPVASASSVPRTWTPSAASMTWPSSSRPAASPRRPSRLYRRAPCRIGEGVGPGPHRRHHDRRRPGRVAQKPGPIRGGPRATRAPGRWRGSSGATARTTRTPS